MNDSDDESDEYIIRPYFKKYFVDLIMSAILSYALSNLQYLGTLDWHE